MEALGKHLIRLHQSAEDWEMGLVLGNGTLGASIEGKINEEEICINEESLFYGGKHSRKNPDTKKYWKKVRSLLLEGKAKEAQFLARMAMTSTPKYNNPYQPAGFIKLHFMEHEGSVSYYERVLDIDRALAMVTYEMDGKRWQREHFVSGAYQVFATKISCSEAAGITVSVNVNRKPFEEKTGKLVEGESVFLEGHCGEGGMGYLTAVAMQTVGGSQDTIGDFVYGKEADTVYLYVACATDKDDPKYREKVRERLKLACEAGYDKIREQHLKDYQNLYGRMSLSLDCKEIPELGMDEMLRELRDGKQEHMNYLTETLFAFARYLLISSSYNCRYPANLQGVWNGRFEPPWQSQYTININEQMNYWIAEKCNLSECMEPVIEQVKRLAVAGKSTAKELYGCRGFCVHHNTNVWDETDPEGIMGCSPFWPMGGVWLILNLQNHYLYTENEKFLEECLLPVMREAIRFFEDYLYELPDGTLWSGPSVSPENSYYIEGQGMVAICMAPAMDCQLLKELLGAYLRDVMTLPEDKRDLEDIRKIQKMYEKIPPIRVSGDDRIMEWQEEYREVEPGHRHMSHLFGLHPGTQISEETPELFAAAEKTLETRLRNGGGATGWSRAWAACMEARLKKGDQMAFHVRKLLEISIKDNLLDIHPPFQIDGNFGVAESICEALVQSHNGYIELLPALPPEWQNGKVEGMILQGAIQADFEWKEGKLLGLTLTALKKDTETILKYQGSNSRIVLKKEQPYQVFPA